MILVWDKKKSNLTKILPTVKHNDKEIKFSKSNENRFAININNKIISKIK